MPPPLSHPLSPVSPYRYHHCNPAEEKNTPRRGDDGGPAMEHGVVLDRANSSSNHRHLPKRKVSRIDDVQHTTGVFGASSNLVNSVVGAGIIGIPYALNQAGFAVGVVLLCLVGYFADKSLRMIVELASFHPKLHNLGVLTYEDLMRIPFGTRGSNFILASMFIIAYGSSTAYLMWVGRSMYCPHPAAPLI